MGVTLRNHVTSHLMTKSVSGGAEGGVPSLHLMSKENRVLKSSSIAQVDKVIIHVGDY